MLWFWSGRFASRWNYTSALTSDGLCLHLKNEAFAPPRHIERHSFFIHRRQKWAPPLMIALRYSQPTHWHDQPMILEGWRKGIWGVWMNQSLNSSNANGLTIKVQSNFWWSPFLWLALPPRDFTKASQKRNPRRICQNFHSTLKSTAIEDKSDCISKTEKQDTLTLFRQDREFVLKNRIFSIDREYTHFCLSSPAHFIFFPHGVLFSSKKMERAASEDVRLCLWVILAAPPDPQDRHTTAGQRTRRSILT